jgi:hypothetical protein
MKLTSSITEIGEYNWILCISYIFSYFIVYLCVCKGVKLSGLIATYSATAPFFLLTILSIKGYYLPGS